MLTFIRLAILVALCAVPLAPSLARGANAASASRNMRVNTHRPSFSWRLAHCNFGKGSRAFCTSTPRMR